MTRLLLRQQRYRQSVQEPVMVAQLAAPLPALLLIAGLLTGCATQQQTAEQPAGRHFYPPEICQGLFAGRYQDMQNYWHARRWCEQREMGDSWNL